MSKKKWYSILTHKGPLKKQSSAKNPINETMSAAYSGACIALRAGMVMNKSSRMAPVRPS